MAAVKARGNKLTEKPDFTFCAPASGHLCRWMFLAGLCSSATGAAIKPSLLGEKDFR